MRASTRLWFAVAPGVVGVITLAALAYWGEYGRQAPGAFVAVAAIATFASIGVAWWTIRSVSHRIDRLGHEAAAVRRQIAAAGSNALRAAGLAAAAPDELESVERLIARLAGAVVAAEQEASAREAAASRRLREAGAMLRATAADVATRVDEARLPLHILLENHFGDLNENQEEMLGAARAATDAADEAVRRAIAVLSASDGVLALRHDRIHGGELVDGLLAPLGTLAEDRAVRLTRAIDAPLPALVGDRVRLQEAVRALFTAALLHASRDSAATVRAGAVGDALRLQLEYDGAAVAGMPLLFGESLVAAHGGAVRVAPGTLEIRLPLGRATG